MSRAALLLIDFQRDFLASDGRLPVARSQVEPVIAAANAAVARARAQGDAIVAIGNEFPRRAWIANLFRKFSALAGSRGATWDERVDRAGAAYFPKSQADAFGNPALGDFLKAQRIGEVTLAGLFANACVAATANGAMAHGLKVNVLADAVAAGSDAARAGALRRLERRGAHIVRS